MPSRALTGSLALLLTSATTAGVAGVPSRHLVTSLHQPAAPLNQLAPPPAQIQRGPLWLPDTALEPLAWSDLDGWREDNHAEAFATFAASCRAVIGHARASTEPRPHSGGTRRYLPQGTEWASAGRQGIL